MTVEYTQTPVKINFFGHEFSVPPDKVLEMIANKEVLPGPVLKNLHRFPEETWTPIIGLAKEVQTQFWGKWWPFRVGVEGDEKGNRFEHSMAPFDRDKHPKHGIRGLFARFLELNKPTLVVDVGGGAAAMLPALGDEYDKDILVGYFVFDNEFFDVSDSKMWRSGVHMGRHYAGTDLSSAMADAPHGTEVFERVTKIGSASFQDVEKRTPAATAFIFMAYFILFCMLIILFCVAYWNWGPSIITN